jgi:DNA mismatch endonuclease (patch repair protein)
MTDVHSPAVRSKNMRAIRSANTKPEMLVRKGLHAAGLRFRLGGAGLLGRPDLVLPKFNAVVFVHGCFWHGHGCNDFKLPISRRDFWEKKIYGNRERDNRVVAGLTAGGWRVGIVWGCAIKQRNVNSKFSSLENIVSWIRTGKEAIYEVTAIDAGERSV